MSLTDAERIELNALEEDARNLAKLVMGGGSKNQLNRLLVLAQGKNTQLTTRVVALETKAETILDLVRKLQ